MSDVLRSTSQTDTAQDLWVDRVLGRKENGFFVDLGAYDGLKGSNTASLEDQRGWRGLLIEAADEVFQSLQINRPLADCVQAFAWNEEGKTVEFSFADGLSGVQSFLPAKLRQRYRKKLRAKPARRLTTTTLQRVMDERNVPETVDYLSIDANGADHLVLQGVDFSKRLFRTITVEHNHHPARRRTMIDHLVRHGYSHEGDRAYDAFFVCEDLSGCGVRLKG